MIRLYLSFFVVCLIAVSNVNAAMISIEDVKPVGSPSNTPINTGDTVEATIMFKTDPAMGGNPADPALLAYALDLAVTGGLTYQGYTTDPAFTPIGATGFALTGQANSPAGETGVFPLGIATFEAVSAGPYSIGTTFVSPGGYQFASEFTSPVIAMTASGTIGVPEPTSISSIVSALIVTLAARKRRLA